MTFSDIHAWIASCLLLGLRVAPVFAYAPPFTLTRLPRMFLLLFGLGLSIVLISAEPARRLPGIDIGTLLPAAFGELALGISFVLVFQLCFAALQFSGRLIDIQAGYGLASLIDPSTRAQTPLVGTMFAYATGALFFSVGGHLELLRILSFSLERVPLGGWSTPASLDHLAIFVSAMFLAGLGVAGAAVLALFLTDVAIALLARTVPQMNVLILGMQVKSAALFVVLPLCFGFGGALMVRMIRLTLQPLPEFF